MKKNFDKLREVAESATSCSVCCSPVVHHSADEGTQSYEALINGPEELLQICDAVQGFTEEIERLKIIQTGLGQRLLDLRAELSQAKELVGIVAEHWCEGAEKAPYCVGLAKGLRAKWKRD